MGTRFSLFYSRGFAPWLVLSIVFAVIAIAATSMGLARAAGVPASPGQGKALTKCTGNQACPGLDPDTVPDGSCNGDYSCHLAAGPIGAGACNGFRACDGTKGPVAAASCNGDETCYLVGGAVSAGSCVGYRACFLVKQTVGPGSCVGDFSCNNQAYRLTWVGAGSCKAEDACAETGGTVGDASCNGHRGCFRAVGPIANQSCNAESACMEAEGGPVGSGSCNSMDACFLARGSIGNYSCNTTSEVCLVGPAGGVGDCEYNDAMPAECSAFLFLDGFEQPVPVVTTTVQ